MSEIAPLAVDKVLWMKPGEGIAASGHIPVKAEFFRDHFPDFPILPGVLALEMLKQTAHRYLDTVSGGKPQHYFLKEIHGTRFLTYLKPGDPWESQLKLLSQKGNETHWAAELRSQGKVAVKTELTLEVKVLAEPVLAS